MLPICFFEKWSFLKPKTQIRVPENDTLKIALATFPLGSATSIFNHNGLAGADIQIYDLPKSQTLGYILKGQAQPPRGGSVPYATLGPSPREPRTPPIRRGQPPWERGKLGTPQRAARGAQGGWKRSISTSVDAQLTSENIFVFFIIFIMFIFIITSLFFYLLWTSFYRFY